MIVLYLLTIAVSVNGIATLVQAARTNQHDRSLIRMSDALNRLTASVSALTSVSASAVALLGTLAEEIRNNVDDSDALNSLADSIDAQKAALADAVVANTPAADEPSPPADTGSDTGTGDATSETPPADATGDGSTSEG